MQMSSRARRLAVAVGMAIGVAAIAVGPALADASTPTANLSGGFSSILAPGSIGKTVYLSINGNAALSMTFKGVTVQIDVSGLAGVATVTPQTSACTTAGTLITCDAANFKTTTFVGTSQSIYPYLGQEAIPLTVAPVAGASAGASGNVTVDVSGSGAVNPGSSTGSISLADGPDLAVVGGDPNVATSVSATAGSSYNHSLKFTNVGDQAAQGVTVEINSGGYGVDIPETRKGCEYAAPYEAYCYIPVLVAPGATETLSPSLQVLTTTDLMWGGVQVTVVPGYACLPANTVGTGKAFALVDSTGASQVPVTGQTSQTNIDYPDNSLGLKLTVSATTADIAAQLSMFPFSGNDEYLVSAGLTNDGSGYVNLGQSANYELTGDFTVPSGVSVVSVPADWIPVVSGAPDYSATGQPGYAEPEESGPGSECPSWGCGRRSGVAYPSRVSFPGKSKNARRAGVRAEARGFEPRMGLRPKPH